MNFDLRPHNNYTTSYYRDTLQEAPSGGWLIRLPKICFFFVKMAKMENGKMEKWQNVW